VPPRSMPNSDMKSRSGGGGGDTPATHPEHHHTINVTPKDGNPHQETLDSKKYAPTQRRLHRQWMPSYLQSSKLGLDALPSYPVA
jgi:hypothetical protein